jgi:hypothetical protein
MLDGWHIDDDLMRQHRAGSSFGVGGTKAQ